MGLLHDVRSTTVMQPDQTILPHNVSHSPSEPLAACQVILPSSGFPELPCCPGLPLSIPPDPDSQLIPAEGLPSRLMI